MIRALTAIALLLVTTACNRTPAANNSAAPAANTTAAAPAPAPQTPAPANIANAAQPNTAAEKHNTPPRRPEGCAGEIGVAEAQELADQCREVSPATRPPCNPSNSCELIQSEIARGCEQLGEDAPTLCSDY